MFRGIQNTVLLLLAAAFCVSAAAQQNRITTTIDNHAQLITASVDDANLVTLQGNTRPEANATNDLGRVADDLPLEHMMLQLRRSPQQEAAIEAYIDQLHDPASPNFHHWLTAKQIGQKYGLAPADIKVITGWLSSHRFTVNFVYPNRLVIDFSGTAGQVREAFHTEIHNLQVGTEKHIANMSDPKIPAALAPAVVGVVSLHNFMPRPMHQIVRPSAQPGHPMLTSGNAQFLAAADLETIYNFSPVFARGISGQGQTIVVIENSDIFAAADWNTYRSVFGLSSYSGTLVQSHPTATGNNCTDPGVNGDDGEATLDVEVASAAAPSATINVASCADTATNFGGYIAMQNMLNSATPPAIISISYGASETEDGAAFNAAINTMYQQGAGEGVSIFVSSGDQLAAVADRDHPEAVNGVNVNGWGSTVYNVSVGGTDYSDTYSGTTANYWSTTNTSTWGSALSYIPEIPWNDSCASTLIAQYVTGSSVTYGTSSYCNSLSASSFFLNVIGASGGPSACATGTPNVSTPYVVSGTCAGYAKPSWQKVFGNPADGVRDLPDVSLFAANGVWEHAYIICFSDVSQGGAACTGTPDNWSGIGGTSASSPIMAGVQALINQSTSQSWGNPNPTYYQLASTEYGTSGSTTCNSSTVNPTTNSCIFYDVTMGDIDAPCTGTVNCYLPSGTYGVLSTSDSAYRPAYATTTGWDFATGIGTVNVDNLVTGWPGGSGKTPTTTTLVLSSGGTVTLGTSVTATATISPAPPDGETVTFNLTGAVSGSATNTTSGGVATVTIQTGDGTNQIPGGIFNVTATYSGDTTLAASTSAAATLNVQDFAFSSSSISINVSAPGQSGQGTINFSLLGGLATAPTFACTTGLPSESSCAFTATSATQETVTISTTAPSSMLPGPNDRGNRMLYMFVLTAMAAFLLATRRKLRTTAAFGAVAMLALVMLLPACSSSGGTHNPGTPTGPATVTVTATDGTLSHTVTINLNVQ